MKNIIAAILLICIIIGVCAYAFNYKSGETVKREKFIENINNSMMEKYPDINIPVVKVNDSLNQKIPVESSDRKVKNEFKY